MKILFTLPSDIYGPVALLHPAALASEPLRRHSSAPQVVCFLGDLGLADVENVEGGVSTTMNNRRLKVMIAAVLIAPKGAEAPIGSRDDEQWLGRC